MTGIRRAAVLGSPIEHSLSPVLHRAAYSALGLDWQYTAIEVGESDFSSFWNSLDDSWVGLSLTMPLKVVVLTHLDAISDRANAVRAVNTVVFDGGLAMGHNTDVPGMIHALDAAEPNRDRVQSAALIGAGATARSAIAAILERHTPEVPITAYARRAEQVSDLVDVADSLGGAVVPGVWSQLSVGLTADLVVSTLPGGVDLPVTLPASVGVLLDVAYDPWPTPLSTRWRAAGGSVATGADLLLWQAADQVTLMTGMPAPIDAMRAALEAALADRVDAGI